MLDVLVLFVPGNGAFVVVLETDVLLGIVEGTNVVSDDTVVGCVIGTTDGI